jgi:hypothetical protein
MAEIAAPRKRGRPPKPGGPKPPKAVTLDANGQPRKRGRPPKDPAEKKTAKPKAAAAADESKKGRGRPRKSDATPAKPAPAKPVAKKGKASESKGLSIASLGGKYTVQCEQIEKDWPEQAEDMTLRIVPRHDDQVLAAFDFGILQGVMLLAPDKQALDAFAARERDGANASDEDGEGEDEDDEDDDEPPAKKAKKDAPLLKSRRVVFKWRGEETSTSQVYADDTRDNEGHLEFTDDDATNFVGYGTFPALGKNCKFTGERVSGPAGPAPNWNSYSQDAAKAANKRRWW